MTTIVMGQPEMRELRPTMSKTEDLLACQFPWGKKVPVVKFRGTPEQRYGSAFHEILAALIPYPPRKINPKKVAKKWGIQEVDELIEHIQSSHKVLSRWLSGDNRWGVNFAKRAKARVETAIAYNVVSKSARSIAPPDPETHIYKGLSAEEFPGTADLIIDRIETKKDAPDVIIVDHKTGEGFGLPHENGQLLSLAQAERMRSKAKRVGAAIFHASRVTEPYIYDDEYEPEELTGHGKRLLKTWQNLGGPSLTPGPYCSTCPYLIECPAHQSMVKLEEETSLVPREKDGTLAMTPERMGSILQLLTRYDAFSERFREEKAKPWIKTHGPAVRPDGKLGFVLEVSRQNLSQASILRACKTRYGLKGKEKAEEIYTMLREIGAIETSESERIQWKSNE